VQHVRYVAIQTGLGRGGGYQPHPAADVFAKNYGDCKDKANLMRTMLKAVGVESYPVVIYANDRDRVREEWPSPQQFNHCILAARLKDAPKVNATVKDPVFGDLVLFDPTDEHTRFGDIPRDEENSLALLVSPESKSLLRVPATSASVNRIEREVEASIDPSGKLRASVHEHGFGHAGAALSGEKQHRSDSDYRKRLERWVSGSAPGASLVSIKTGEDGTSGRFDLDIELTASPYAQSMQGRLLVLRPSILDRRDPVYLTEPARKYPIVFEAQSFKETARILLPADFQVDELVQPFELKNSFARYRGKCEAKLGALECVRQIEIENAKVPADQYQEVRDFFSKVAGYEQSPVVLAKN